MFWIFLFGAMIMPIVALKLFMKYFSGTFLKFIMNLMHTNIETIKSKLFDEAVSKIKSNKKNNPLEILELGIGTGENFRHFPKGSNVTILDKTDIYLPYLNDSIKKNNRSDLNVSKLVVSKAEEMLGIESESMDLVVHTFILCSVDDHLKVMNQVYRVLKPGGVCIFMEHSIDNENKKRKMLQKIMTVVLGDRFLDMRKIISSGPYEELQLKNYEMKSVLISFSNPVVYGYGIKS